MPAKLAELVRAHDFPELFEATASSGVPDAAVAGQEHEVRTAWGGPRPRGDFCRGLGREA